MRARVLLWVCLGLNVLLAVMVLLLARDYARGQASTDIYLQGANGAKQFKTNVVVRRQGFHWREIESTDFPTFITNLRRIGCPEKTIRDIIVAEVNEVFAERLAREINLPEQKWWEADSDMDVFEAGMDQVRALETEKGQLLAHLLGADWNNARTTVNASLVRFDGPVLSALPIEVKSNVEQIEARLQRSRAALEEQAKQEGRTVHPQEVTELQEETRKQLAAVLTPDQMEEYLLRYSSTADKMRNELRGLGSDEEEFRRIFRVRDGFDRQIAGLIGKDPATVQRRTELEHQRDEALRQAIGGERYALYEAARDPLFQQAQSQAEESGAPPEKVLPLFRINQAVQEEIARIQADPNLSEDQRKLALATVQQQKQNSIERILGDQPAEELPAEAPQTAQAPMPPMPLFVPPEELEVPRNTKGPTFESTARARGNETPEQAAVQAGAIPSSSGPTVENARNRRRPLVPAENASKGPVYDRLP